MRVRCEVGVPAIYQDKRFWFRFRSYILADEPVILEIDAVPTLLATHEMQPQIYPRMSGLRVGLLLNFHVLRVKDGLRRFAG